MPKKRRLTTWRKDQLERQLDQTRSSLRATRRELLRHYEQTHGLVRQVDALTELFSAFTDAWRGDVGEQPSRIG